MEKTRLLVVDDEPDVVETLRFRLESAGYETVAATNGAEALELLRREKFDLILADFMMPEVNGLELTRLIKAHPKWFETKVLLFSCNTEPEYRQRAIDLGAVDYLPKTEGGQNIVERVRDILSQNHGRHSRETEEKTLAEVRAQIVLLSQNLIDFLHLAKSTGEVGQPAQFAIDSARRIATDIQRLAAGKALAEAIEAAEQRQD